MSEVSLLLVLFGWGSEKVNQISETSSLAKNLAIKSIFDLRKPTLSSFSASTILAPLQSLLPLISIPKKLPHSFYNSGHEDAHYVQEFFPALKIDSLFETFFALASAGKLDQRGRPNILKTVLILLHFEKEIRLAHPNWMLQKIIFNLLAPIARLMGYKAV